MKVTQRRYWWLGDNPISCRGIPRLREVQKLGGRSHRKRRQKWDSYPGLSVSNLCVLSAVWHLGVRERQRSKQFCRYKSVAGTENRQGKRQENEKNIGAIGNWCPQINTLEEVKAKVFMSKREVELHAQATLVTPTLHHPHWDPAVVILKPSLAFFGLSSLQESVF